VSEPPTNRTLLLQRMTIVVVIITIIALYGSHILPLIVAFICPIYVKNK
jgi:hypothetical protein